MVTGDNFDQVSSKRLLRKLHLFEVAKRIKDALGSFTPGRTRWRQSALELYGEFLRPGDLAFDIGANIGARTDLFLALGAHVIAVEPQSACAARLNRKYANDQRVVVVPKAAGRAAGMAQMMLSQADTISSMSSRWVDAVRSSGRFANYEWQGREQVTVTTLDDLIAQFGRPTFCKIDVEGFESEVIAGLSEPIPALSFEFTPELADAAFACIDRLAKLGEVEFNYDLNDSMHLQLTTWAGPEDIKARLRALDTRQFGDIYARFVRHPE